LFWPFVATPSPFVGRVFDLAGVVVLGRAEARPMSCAEVFAVACVELRGGVGVVHAYGMGLGVILHPSKVAAE
jgi:hypothetical protein